MFGDLIDAHSDYRHISTYLSAFFALPIQRQNGEVLTHEEVINKLDDETVSYEVGLGSSGVFSEAFRVSIKVETAAYDIAVAWLKDLVAGARFDKERCARSHSCNDSLLTPRSRLQVTVAKIQQSLPEMKRNGNTVLGSLWTDLLYNKSYTSRAGGVLEQVDFIPKLAKQLQDDPDSVIADFETMRRTSTDFLFLLTHVRDADRFDSHRTFGYTLFSGGQRLEAA